jgi:hypothetical protein
MTNEPMTSDQLGWLCFKWVEPSLRRLQVALLHAGILAGKDAFGLKSLPKPSQGFTFN